MTARADHPPSAGTWSSSSSPSPATIGSTTPGPSRYRAISSFRRAMSTWMTSSEQLEILLALPVAHRVGEPGELVASDGRVDLEELLPEELLGRRLSGQLTEGLGQRGGERLERRVVLGRGPARRRGRLQPLLDPREAGREE